MTTAEYNHNWYGNTEPFCVSDEAKDTGNYCNTSVSVLRLEDPDFLPENLSVPEANHYPPIAVLGWKWQSSRCYRVCLD